MGVRRSTAGGRQSNLAIGASVVTLTAPATGNVAEVFVRSEGGLGSISFTTDGTDPTATLGTVVSPGGIISLNSRDELEKFRAIRVGASGEIDVEYFTDLSG